jgi:hypothetical protein
MTWAATASRYRLGGESVGLPHPGQRVLVCTIRRKPFPTDALIAAFGSLVLGPAAKLFELLQAAGLLERAMSAFRNPSAPTAEELHVLFYQSDTPLPTVVLSALKSAGFEPEYAYSGLVEAYRVAPEDAVKGQHRTPDGWACDRQPLLATFDLEPTHWTQAPERFVP